MNDTIFNRYLLSEAKKRLNLYCTKNNINYRVLLKNSWGYSYDYARNIEFHINKCEACPNGFFWNGNGRGVTLAQAEGIQAFLNTVNIKG